MSKFKTIRPLYGLLVMVVLLAGCGPTLATPDATQVVEMIRTGVALTIAAEKAGAAGALPTLVPTETPTPTETPIQAATFTPFPTFTPFVIPTLTQVGGGGVVTQADYACNVFPTKPRDNTTFKPNDSFDVVWTIQNTGTKKWVTGLDLKYFSGPQMTMTTRYSLPEMKPNESITVRFEAKAPAEKGFHVMTWTIDGFCYPYVAINVEKP